MYTFLLIETCKRKQQQLTNCFFFIGNVTLFVHKQKEHRVLKKKGEREQEYGLSISSSRDDLRNNLLARMKSLTDASDDVCISLLQRNSYDLEVSVEAYLSSSQAN
jgi:UBA-like domain